jgi:hypothetical protein
MISILQAVGWRLREMVIQIQPEYDGLAWKHKICYKRTKERQMHLATP